MGWTMKPAGLAMKTVAPSGVIAYPSELERHVFSGIGVPIAGYSGFGLPEGVAVKSYVVKVDAQVDDGSAARPYARVPAGLMTPAKDGR